MDTLLVDYCKQNKIVYVDYTYKMLDHNAFNVFIKMLDNKNKEVIYRFDIGKAYKPFVKVLKEKSFKDIPSLKEWVMYIYKNNSRTLHSTTFITKRIIDEILVKEEPDCPICLEKATNMCMFCPTCKAKYHLECISDSKYNCLDKNGDLACCCCKQTMCLE
jgi:hypothetical protein